MDRQYSIKRLWLQKDAKAYKAWSELMEKASLHTDEQLDYTLGIYDNEKLIASASFQKSVIKCVAVCRFYQSENLLTALVTQLLEEMSTRGFVHYFLYTQPEKEMIFNSLGFKKIIATNDVLFMEQGVPDFKAYLELLQKYQQNGDNAAIVMNANPFTKGHQYLVETAAAKSDHVYVFVLSEELSEFTSEERMNLVKQGVKHLTNVTVLPTQQYLVSQATFPAYFLKDKAELSIAKVQATLDARLFKEEIAPILMIEKRYVGEEPYSPVTEVYNQAMRQVFGNHLNLVVLPRKEIAGDIISATKVRKALKEKDFIKLRTFLPETTFDYIVKKFK